MDTFFFCLKQFIMKNLFLLCIIFLSSACSNSSNENTKLLNDKNRPTEIINVDEEINTYIMNPDKYSWADIDKYYQRMINSNIDNNLKDNLKNSAINGMINYFDFIKKAPTEKIQFYLKEYVTLKYNMSFLNHAKLIIELLDRQAITKEVGKKLALEGLDYNMKLINSFPTEKRAGLLADQKEGIDAFKKLIGKD